MEQQFVVTRRYAVLEREKPVTSLRDPHLNASCFYENGKAKQFCFRMPDFGRRCVCNPTVKKCAVLTNCVGYDKSLFYEGYISFER